MPVRICTRCGTRHPTSQRHDCRTLHGTDRGGRPWRQLRRQIIQRDNGRCVHCGADYPLEVHHIDGNRHNNHPLNLQTVCRACHPR